MSYVVLPDEIELPKWNASRLNRLYPQVSFSRAAPKARLDFLDQKIVPLSDTPPTVPSTHYVSSRTIRDDGNTATVVYVTAAKTPEMIAEEEANKPPLPSSTVYANANLTIDQFGNVDGIDVSDGLTMAFSMDVGIYWIFFQAVMPDTSYTAFVATDVGRANVTVREADYLEIAITDAAGAAIDPTQLSITVIRRPA